MELDFNSLIDGYDEYEEVYLDLLTKTLSYLKIKCSPIVSVSLVDEKLIHQINRDYRHIDRVTDVISFAFLDNEDRESILKSKGDVVLGDIYICLDVAKRQAEEYGHSLNRELRFLFIHGLLHLLGYDHMTKEDEEIMFPLQEKILSL
ncbi:MAG: rRNA maturation RNase YbeY [Erysipelotrichaceae bacterium]|nr:rRNA maturation RNase YbeY [Erysipelotrichaceae bacterium]